MERRWAAIAQAVCSVLRGLTAATLLLVAVGCSVVDLQNPWEVYYHAEKYGTEKENILEHFNIHRGRWWNYYTRGACFLEHGYYDEAQNDFAVAIRIRPDEARDARMYGMHFVDYFPHRETGIALYFEGKRKTGAGIRQERAGEAQVDLFERAVAELKVSLDQEESSRAKYYFNQANKALWVTSRNDRIPPVIHVERSIYTNQRIIQLGVTVTDDRSGVEEIRVSAPNGGVKIDRPRLFVELAQEKVTETVELTIDSREKVVVVEIEASDLAGNRSDPYRVRITVDTHAPMAAVSFVGDARWRGRFAALVRAVDDSGLREIRVGGDQSDRFACYGEKQYKGTVFGTPVGGELTIRVVDVAGNTLVASIPVWESGSRAPMPRAPWQQAHRMFPLMERGVASDWDRYFSPVPLAALSAYRPRRPVALYWGGDAQTASLASFGVLTASSATEREQPKFHFPTHVKRPDGQAKETSQDFFVVEGAIRNAQGVTGIKVDGIDLDRDTFARISMRNSGDLLFSHRVELAHYPLDRKMPIEIEVFRDKVPCADETLWIIKKNNCVRDQDAVYSAVLLRRVVATPYRKTIPGVVGGVVPRDVYDDVFASLEKLRAPDPYSLEPLERLRMQNVMSVWNSRQYDVAVTKSVDKVLRKVGSDYDLVIHGDVGLWAGGEGEEDELGITLRAMDLVTEKDLQFQPLGTEHPVILAETRVPWKRLDGSLDAEARREYDAEARREYMGVLAAKVRAKLPRIQAEAEPLMTRAGTAADRVSINRGTDIRLFPAMSLGLYTYGDAARSGNIYLKKIGNGRIAEADGTSSRVRLQGNLALVESGLIAITK